MKYEKFLKFFLVFSIGIFISLSVFSSLKESLTFDEVVTIQEGKNAWLHHTFDIEPFHPPFAKDVQVAPIVFTENVLHIPLNQVQEKNIARLVVIAFGVSLLLLVFFVTKTYFGQTRALLAVTLLAFEPNVLAMSHVVNTDMVVTVLIFLCYILFIQLLNHPTKKLYILFSIVLGLGFATKISFADFYVFSSLLVLLYIKKWDTFRWVWQQKKFIVLTIGIALFVIWTTYFYHWQTIVKQRQDSNRFSERLLRIAKEHHNQYLTNLVMMGKTVKIPLGDYIGLYKNIAVAKINYTTTNDHYTCFFLGTYYLECKWFFMPATFALKTPLPLLLLSLVGLVLLVKQKKKKEELYILIPIVVVIFEALRSGTFPLNRYMLPAYPFLVIVAAKSVELIKTKRFLTLTFLGLLLLWQIVQVCFAFPHFLSYANELAGPKNKLYLLFQDANLDWGQSLPDVYDYAKKNNIGTLNFSYYGRDNGDLYGLKSDKPYGSFRSDEICAFHVIPYPPSAKRITVISISNWYICKYNALPEYKNPKAIISDSFLVF